VDGQLSNDDEVKLPKANLVTAINGCENALKSMLEDNSSSGFNGYVKVSIKVGSIPAHGVVVILSGKPEVAYFNQYQEKLFGQEALPKIHEVTESRKCVIKLYAFPVDAKDDLSSIVETFANCKIDIDKFWTVLKEKGEVVGAAVPGSGDKVGVMDRPQVDDMMEETGDAFKVIVGDGIVVVEDSPDDDKPGDPIDDKKITKVEEALMGREEKIRQEIYRKLEEREELKKEEEKFLKMDEVFSKLLKEREEEIKSKATELSEKEESLKEMMNKKEKMLASKEEDLKQEMLKLNVEKEEAKQREQKLLEMEKMFRRVLANTEDRLRKKEEELIMKEEELKREVAERMKLIEDLKMREAKVLEMEQHLEASSNVDEVASEEIKKREERIKDLEEDLKKAKEEFETIVKETEEHKAAHENVVNCLKVLDDLLGKLPEDIISEFAQSEDFELYEKVMRHFKIIDE
jgi:hypothetical protein